MEKNYSPKDFEEKISQKWEEYYSKIDNFKIKSEINFGKKNIKEKIIFFLKNIFKLENKYINISLSDKAVKSLNLLDEILQFNGINNSEIDFKKDEFLFLLENIFYETLKNNDINKEWLETFKEFYDDIFIKYNKEILKEKIFNSDIKNKEKHFVNIYLNAISLSQGNYKDKNDYIETFLFLNNHLYNFINYPDRLSPKKYIEEKTDSKLSQKMSLVQLKAFENFFIEKRYKKIK